MVPVEVRLGSRWFPGWWLGPAWRQSRHVLVTTPWGHALFVRHVRDIRPAGR